jgi:hypothetical protein
VPLVLLDIDNTLADLNTELRRLFGVSLLEYPAPEVPPGFWSTPEAERVCRGLPALEMARAAAWLFRSAGYEVAYYTSRPHALERATLGWLRANDFPPGPLHWCGGVQDKAALVGELRPDIVADDDPRVVAAVLGSGAAVMVPPWPYNASVAFLAARMPWEEVVRLFSP